MLLRGGLIGAGGVERVLGPVERNMFYRRKSADRLSTNRTSVSGLEIFTECSAEIITARILEDTVGLLYGARGHFQRLL